MQSRSFTASGVQHIEYLKGLTYLKAIGSRNLARRYRSGGLTVQLPLPEYIMLGYKATLCACSNEVPSHRGKSHVR